jgi:hypothetical protein
MSLSNALPATMRARQPSHGVRMSRIDPKPPASTDRFPEAEIQVGQIIHVAVSGNILREHSAAAKDLKREWPGGVFRALETFERSNVDSDADSGVRSDELALRETRRHLAVRQMQSA